MALEHNHDERHAADIFRAAGALIISMADQQAGVVARIAAMAAEALARGRRIYVLGCGGSAADAQHFAGEMVGRFKKERRGLPCIALTTDTSILTAVGNDYGFEKVFERQVDALVEPGDLVIAISTSGNSAAVLVAARAARRKGAQVAGMTGRGGGALKAETDCCLCADSAETCRAQECHAVAIHAICELVE